MLTQIDLEKIDNIVTKRVKIEINHLQKDIKRIKKDLKIVINFFDNETLKLQKHIN